jgi:hypothetical protein
MNDVPTTPESRTVSPEKLAANRRNAQEGSRPNEHHPPGTISNEQLAANRANAGKSTGPRTPEGKARSSRNALKHGLCSVSPRHMVIPGEDPDEFWRLHEEIFNDMRPTQAAERVMVERIVLAQWRLRRAVRYEGHIIEASLIAVRRQDRHELKWHKGDEEERRAFAEENAAAEMARAVSRALESKAYANLMRYENNLERGLFRTIEDLKHHKETAMPIGALAPLPKVFDPKTGEQFPGAKYHLPPGADEADWGSYALYSAFGPDWPYWQSEKRETNPNSTDATQDFAATDVTQADPFDAPRGDTGEADVKVTQNPFAPRDAAVRPPHER